MFGPQTTFHSPLSGKTIKQLTFKRSQKQKAPSGEWITRMVPTCTVTAHVQAREASTVLNHRLATTYAQIFDVQVKGDTKDEIRHNDRVEINGAECIVETVVPWGTHTDIQAGAIRPGEI